MLTPLCTSANLGTRIAGSSTNGVSPASGPYQTYIQRVSTISANDAWGVGYYNQTSSSPVSTFTEHWNGTQWTHVPSPNPKASNDSELEDVSAVSANDVWAVGTWYDFSSALSQSLVEHWNGTKWTIVPSPNPGSAYGDRVALHAVDAVSASDIWVAGMFTNYVKGGKVTGFAEHWNGTKWTLVHTPNPVNSDDTEVADVSAVSATDVWVTGVTCPAPTSCTTSGQYSTFTEHWNGKTWAIVPSPSPAANSQLAGVSAVSAKNVWAVGTAGQGISSSLATLIEHWNGKKWIRVKSPSPTSIDALASVDAVSANDVWAVGIAFNGSGVNTLIEHWNGTKWTHVASPNTPFITSALIGASAISASDIWAGGASYNGLVYSSLFEHWNGSKWTIVKS
jgi:hypothetical protein